MNSTYTDCLWSIAFAFLPEHLASGGSYETWYPYLVALGLQRPKPRHDVRYVGVHLSRPYAVSVVLPSNEAT
jgi:hypothetical protein